LLSKLIDFVALILVLRVELHYWHEKFTVSFQNRKTFQTG